VRGIGVRVAVVAVEQALLLGGGGIVSGCVRGRVRASGLVLLVLELFDISADDHSNVWRRGKKD